MKEYKAYYEYTDSDGFKIFTVVLLPDGKGKFPVVIERNPYVDSFEYMDENEIVNLYLEGATSWLDNGYARVYQHCRGCGKSEGDFIPYVFERCDGHNLIKWIKNQSFYGGEIYLRGASYLSAVHFEIAPFDEDIKGACFTVKDSERYNVVYKNGFFKRGLYGTWASTLYKKKRHVKKNYTDSSFDLLPLKDFSKTAFGESFECLDEMLKHPDKNDEFWNTHEGGKWSRNATNDAKFPILLATAFNDIFTGGIFEMWNNMSEKTKKMSALVVSPYNHGDSCEEGITVVFPNGKRVEQFGEGYEIDWFNHIRGKREKSPFKQGEITYYRSFENVWKTEENFYTVEKTKEIILGNNEVSYVYNPYDAPWFKGGLSRAFGGSFYQDKPNSRHDIISLFTEPFEEDTFVKGKMKAKLTVKSDCEDTCFYVRISIEKKEGDFGLRDDITSLCYQLGDYKPNSYVCLDFEFDEHAFLVKKGERLRIDLASADNAHYVRHTNQKGLFSEQTTAKVAHNTIDLKNSKLVLPIE